MAKKQEGFNWTPSRKATAQKLITTSNLLASQLDKKGKVKTEFGMFQVADEKGKPVCAFGVVLFEAGILSPSFAGTVGNDEALLKTFRVKQSKFFDDYYTDNEFPDEVIAAAEAVGFANDTENEAEAVWDVRRKKIAVALRHFARTLKKHAFKE